MQPPTAPVVLPPLKPPALRMGPPSHLPPMGGAPGRLPSLGGMPTTPGKAASLPPLRPGLLPDGIPSPPPPISPGDTSRRPARKRVRNINVDPESSGLLENMTATESGTAMSSTAESGSDPALDKPTSVILPKKFAPAPLDLSGRGDVGPPPLRSAESPRPLISPRDSSRSLLHRASFPAPPVGDPTSPTGMPRVMRRPSQPDPFTLPRQPPSLSRQTSSVDSPARGMSRPSSRSVLASTGRAFSSSTAGMEFAAPPRGPRQDSRIFQFSQQGRRDSSQDQGQ